jgi:hypothetical protein
MSEDEKRKFAEKRRGTKSRGLNTFEFFDQTRLIQALDAVRGDFIERGATVLESIIRCPVCRAKRLSTSLAPVATTLSAPGRVEAVTNDGSDLAFSRGRAVLVGKAETLHGWWTL